MSKLNAAQQENLDTLIELLVPLIEEKYTKGAIEHTGVLSDLTDEQLEQCIVEEILDLSVYIMERLRRKVLGIWKSTPKKQ